MGHHDDIAWMDGDTVIDGKTYQIIWSSLRTDRSDPIIQAYYREDGHEAYRRYSEQDILLYNWDLEFGDTFAYDAGFMPGISTWPMEVVRKTTVNINGESRMHIEFHEGTIWTEGIGSHRHPYRPFDYMFVACVYYDLSCVRQHGEHVSNISLANEHCDFHENAWLLHTDSPHEDDALELFPNPVADQLHISGAGPHSPVAVYNQQGQLIYQGLGPVHSVAGFANGMYFIRVDDSAPMQLVVAH